MEKELMNIVNEIIYQQYYMSMDQVHRLFENTNISEYIVLKHIEKDISGNGKTYLKDLEKELKIEMSIVSKIVRNVRDKGYITWKHDGSGEEGTYVILTERGRQLVISEEEKIMNYYGNVIQRFGINNTKQFMKIMKELQCIIHEEFMEEQNEFRSNQ